MKKIIATILVALVTCILNCPALYAYTVNGDVSDWGVYLSDPNANQLGFLNTNLPSGGVNLRYVTDDDDWSGNPVYKFVDPGYSHENTSDAEAIYFDIDDTYTYAYIAIITGTPKDWSAYSPYGDHTAYGDIFIDTGTYQSSSSPTFDESKYEYAINVEDGKLYSVGTTINSDPQFSHESADPWIMAEDGTLIDNPDVSFFSNGTAQNSHYVMEVKIPLSALGLNAQNANNVWIHWTMECGNDVVNLSPVPEPSSMLLLGLGLLGIPFLKRKKHS
ncbi:MAG: PEP-CTERM sorting domain-containing protein [Candidatus Omnitrophota bacterium]